jgi:hypothetical protein
VANELWVEAHLFELPITNVLDGAFAARVRDHFAKLLGYSGDPRTATDPLGSWWREGYQLRNQVVHLGHRPTPEEAHAALLATDTLLGDVGARI